MKKLLSIVLSLVMILTILPTFSVTAFAKTREITPVKNASGDVWLNADGILYWTNTGSSNYSIEICNHPDTIVLKTLTVGPSITGYNLCDVMDKEKYQQGEYRININDHSSLLISYVSPYEKLFAPTNLRWNGNVAQWDSVANAKQYRFRLRDAAGNSKIADTITGTSYDCTAYAPKDGWYFEVYAIGTNYRDSAISESPRKNNGTRTVTPVKNANGDVWLNAEGILYWTNTGSSNYSINIYKHPSSFILKTLTVGPSITGYSLYDVMDKEKYGNGDYRIEINDHSSLLISYVSPYEKLFAPTNLRWNGNVAQWDSVANAKQYGFRLRDAAGNSKIADTITGTSYDCTAYAPKEGWYFEVYAIGTSYRSSGVNESPAYTIPTYTITYNANGGTGTMSSVTLNEDAKYVLPTTCAFTAPEGKEFGNKWIMSIDGESMTLNAGYSISVVADFTLKPVWVDKKITLTFNANGGTGTMSPVNLTYGNSYVLPTSCDFVAPAGKVFANKWIMTIDGESITLSAGYSINAVADFTLKPVWVDYYSFNSTTGIVTINYNGAMPEMAYDEFPWYDDKALIKEVIIGEGVTSISANAFSDCSNITKVTLPSTLKSLSNAFIGTGITTITVPEGVTDIDAWALYNCNSLREIILPSTIKNIGSMALYVSNPALVTVRYNGTESDWAKINIDSSNNITKQGKIIYKHNHTGGTATCQSKAICTICGEAYGSFGTHTYTVEKVAQVNATCTATGTTAVMQCSHCSATTGGDVIPKAAHKYASTYTVDKKATATEDGSKSKHCVNCTAKTSVTVIKKVSNINLSTTKYTYDGKVKSPTLTVKDSAGKALVKGTDYTVTTPSGRKNVGKYTYKITFKGSSYSGTKSLSITINPKGTSISSLTASSKGFTVKWKKQATQTTGYQVRYSLKSDMSSATTKTYSGTSTVSKKIGSLKASKKYYVQVRTYKTVNGTKYYSSWSAKKYVTTKK